MKKGVRESRDVGIRYQRITVRAMRDNEDNTAGYFVCMRVSMKRKKKQSFQAYRLFISVKCRLIHPVAKGSQLGLLLGVRR